MISPILRKDFAFLCKSNMIPGVSTEICLPIVSFSLFSKLNLKLATTLKGILPCYTFKKFKKVATTIFAK